MADFFESFGSSLIVAKASDSVKPTSNENFFLALVDADFLSGGGRVDA